MSVAGCPDGVMAMAYLIHVPWVGHGHDNT